MGACIVRHIGEVLGHGPPGNFCAFGLNLVHSSAF